ncbi:hypothetical protein IAG44_42305 [Streptomyces roseirectus]|uniref:Peptide chain release factor 1 n=1 Tax=Streptomyces roseirectus TaxID=2768066 RepID=A0A7H0IRH2_9ACTN|nr:Vms1/Ankzf1 family peptidyl-tRNA hydrolase [Streptomyces roseirectus]QNP75388.1 hypothetical protein IAG44_42305 [Streptomyces roseirectus]
MRLSFLQPLLDRPGPWATVYADTAQHDESGAKRRELNLRETCRTLEREGADPATVEAVRAQLAGVVPGEEPAGRAVFASGGEVALTRSLVRPPRSPFACWAPLPRLTPLLDLADEDPRCLVAYVDKAGADFELRGAARPSDAGRVEGRQYPMHRTGTAQWNERHFQFKVENTWEHNAAEIAAALASAYEECGADVVLLAGDPRERVAVRERLPGPVRAVTAQTRHGGRAAGSESAALEEDVRTVRRQFERARAEEALDRFRATPTEGVPALVEAAREHRIDTLLVRPDGPALARETWVGAHPDQLAVRRTDARALGESDPACARADDALLRSAAATDADVLVVAHESLPTGGLGALLRWTYEEER